jgi:hypothetical protein
MIPPSRQVRLKARPNGVPQAEHFEMVATAASGNSPIASSRCGTNSHLEPVNGCEAGNTLLSNQPCLGARAAMRVPIKTCIEATYALGFLLVAFNFSAAAQGGSISSLPTFDCAKAKSPLALLICSGQETAKADWDLRIASLARYFSPKEDYPAYFWEDQDKWLTSLNQTSRMISVPSFSRQQISCVTGGAYRDRAELYRSKLTGDALAESRLTPERLSQIQQALIALGFLNGEADGEFGSVTRAAIGKYQEANGFPGSHYLSVEQRRFYWTDPPAAPLSP